jgi:hypothetical protein
MGTRRERQRLEKRRKRERELRKKTHGDRPASRVEVEEGSARAVAEGFPARRPDLALDRIQTRAFRLLMETEDLTVSALQSTVDAWEAAGLIEAPGPLSDQPRDVAADLAEQAWNEAEAGRPTEADQLARQALGVDDTCADALLVLARLATDRAVRGSLLEQAVAAARSALGDDGFEELSSFWAMPDGRPYIRARTALAFHCWEVGAGERAIEHLEDCVLRCQDEDEPGNRYFLLGWCLTCGRDDQARDLMRTFGDEASGVMRWARALERFRIGDLRAARQALHKARMTCPRAEPFLSGAVPPPPLPHSFIPGSPEEAALVAETLTPAFAATSGAREWLAN